MKFSLLFITCFFASSLFAQISASKTQINFGNVYDINPDSQLVKIYNNGDLPVNVNEVRFYDFYEKKPFSANPSTFSILPQDSFSLYVKFSPSQNVTHNSEMILINDSKRGSLAIDLIGQGKYFNNYYNVTENQSEQKLKDTLKYKLALGYASQGYSNRVVMFSNIDNWKVNGRGATNDKTECVYTGRIIENYPFNTGTLVASPWLFNTEHIFPQSLFSQSEPMRSDFHHLFPTDEAANNVRSNYPFGKVTNSTWTSGGSKFDGAIFEPRDEQKGMTARALLYFVTRYQDYSNFLAPFQNEMKQWAIDFPPNSVEIKRNQDINAIQFNRNPFIDYPALLYRITNFTSTSSAILANNDDIVESEINYGTVYDSQDAIYSYVIVNEGNTILHYSNFLLGDARLSFVNSTGANFALQPGQSKTIQVKVNTQTPFTSSLTFKRLQDNIISNIPVIVDAVSSNSISYNSNIKIYPNPSNNFINIEGTQNSNHKIFDLSGKLLIESKLTQISLNNLTKGIYFLEIEQNNFKSYHKIIKE